LFTANFVDEDAAVGLDWNSIPFEAFVGVDVLTSDVAVEPDVAVICVNEWTFG
jgi:hypothetical protein